MKNKKHLFLVLGFVGGLVVAMSSTIYVLTEPSRVAAAPESPWFFPNADGTYRSWVTQPTGVLHYTTLLGGCDEKTFVATTKQEKKDSYFVDLSRIPNGKRITSIRIIPCAAKYVSAFTTSAGSEDSKLNLFYRWNGTEDSVGSLAVSSTSLRVFSEARDYPVSLVKTDKSTLEIGVGFGSGKDGVRVSAIGALLTY